MSRKEKLIKRFLSKPKDFTFDELETMLGYLVYSQDSSGKTTGSSLKFVKPDSAKPIALHKPHPGNIIPEYQMKNLCIFLKGEGLL